MLATDSDGQTPSREYDYEPLDLTRQQIRLLALQPGSFDDIIHCDLQIFDTESAPPYVALSYTWGPLAPTASILVNDKPFRIRKNLYNFLRAYRNDPKNTCYIWIDQICIWQGHTDERNHQVQLMSNIYKSSLWAVIWLGHGVRSAALAFNALRPAHVSERFDIAKTLLRHEYFGRTWVVQEMLLPPSTTAFCGDVWLNFKQLIDAIHHRPRNSSLALGLNGLESHFNVVGVYQAFQFYPKKVLDLHYCVVSFMDHGCEDLRDKIYGILGLMHENERLVVDYTKTIHNIFVETALTIIKSGHWNFDNRESGYVFASHNTVGGQVSDLPALYESSALISNMGLRSYQKVITAFLKDISRAVQIEKGHITATGFDTELERWWFDYDGAKYYRDGTNYGAQSPSRYA